MSPNKNLLDKISDIVARGVDSGNPEKARLDVNELFPSNIDAKEREEALTEASIYFLGAAVPGRDPEGGYVSSAINLKEATLDELAAMREADFGGEDNDSEWEKLLASIQAAPAENFLDGVEVNCPDDRVLFLRKVSCAEALKEAEENLRGSGA